MCQVKDLSYSSSTETKTLGLLWKPHPDSFVFKISPMTSNCDNLIVTKKSVISTIARIFDPLGLIGPAPVLQIKGSPTEKYYYTRLELCGAVLLSKLLKRTLDAFKVNISQIYLWTDSSIVLAWIKKPLAQLKTFVRNRVSIIQELTESDFWKHVNSENNPADILSRGAEATLANIRNSFWIPSVRNVVRKILRTCITCRKVSAKGSQQLMADLPAARVTACRVFSQGKMEEIMDFLSKEQIKWNFNPPSAPHFGGLWEAGVKSLKYHLKSVIGNSILSHEEFLTLVVQIEAVLNSRPICPLSNDPNDVETLTPAHFLVGSSLVAVPDPDYTEIPMNRLSRWQLDRVINLLVGFVTVLLFGVTLLSAFFAKTPPRGLNIYFVICLSLVSLSHVLLIYWYRQGDLDPKFRLLIYYNAFTMVLLSTCALSFFFTEY
ncbi:uncharacterized protein TNCV_1366491 [Trichonephila clavipes]|nr:uncharacterized protein TNCV_1366491 [Trichonephila clavipes]